jgi:hypothetical protein
VKEVIKTNDKKRKTKGKKESMRKKPSEKGKKN